MTTFASSLPETPTEPESDYRDVNLWAVASLLLGVLSVTAAVSWFFVYVPLVGVMVGWKALRQLRHSGEVQAGIALARAGVVTSVFFGLSGAVILQFVTRDVPYGYKEITFQDLQPDSDAFVSRYALELQPTMSCDQKVFIKGFIYPGRGTQNIKELLLVPTLGHCSFCMPQIRSTDLIRVKLVSDLTVDYRSTEIGVGGRLRVDQLSSQAPYALEADHVQ
jgi:hypothetical protein